MLEDPPSLRQLDQSAVFLLCCPGCEESLHAAVLIDGGNHSVAGVGEAQRFIDRLLKDDLEVEALVDASVGVAQLGQAFPQRIRLEI